jgi:ATP-dependent helicase/nuclease subunit A
VISLADNFRSHEMLLRFINPLFTALLRESIGGVGYPEDEALRYGAPEERFELAAARSPGPRAEVHLRVVGRDPVANGEDSDDPAVAELTQVEHEARLVAMRLRELIEAQHPVWDPAERTFRPARWGDMVVLLRSLQNRAEIYAKEFHRLGVPLQVARGGFYDSVEITDLLSLLQLLDNPRQDVPLLAVLRSPLVGLSLDELAQIRMAQRDSHLWPALLRWRDTTHASPPAPGPQEPRTTARERVEDFLARYARWRRLARERPLSQRLETILDETHYAEWLITQPRGGQRLANVQRLLALAQQFDPWQRQGLQRFLRFTEAQREMDTGSEPAPVETTEAVRLTSIHKSKGLEFPIVVVADLAKPFNTRDLHDQVMLDEEFGLCPRVKPPDTGRHYPSLPYWLAQRRQKREAAGEELRLLYVALTRARDTLLLVGTVSESAALQKWPAAAMRGWSDLQILGARSYLDWLGPCLTQLAGDPGWAGRDAGRVELFQWRCHDETGVAGIASAPVAASGNGAGERTLLSDPTPALLEALEARVRWTYPFAAATSERAKTSVSELKRRHAEADEESRLVFWPRGRGPRSGAEGEAPNLGGAEAGVAHHTFLQNVDLERTTSRASLQIEADRLRETGVLTTEQTAALDFAALDRFWQSALGERVRKHAAQVRRELPFTARFTAGDLAACGLPVAAGLTAEEFIVVQGVADLVVLQPGEIWLVDFKTDDVPRRDLPERIEYYTPQLKVYALALERIHGRPVTERWLYFLRPAMAARV